MNAIAESVSDVELSTSAPLPILSPSSSLPRIARPTVFSVKPSPSRQVDVSTASKTENCIDFDAYEDLPSPMLAKLLEQLNRQRFGVFIHFFISCLFHMCFIDLHKVY